MRAKKAWHASAWWMAIKDWGEKKKKKKTGVVPWLVLKKESLSWQEIVLG